MISGSAEPFRAGVNPFCTGAQQFPAGEKSFPVGAEPFRTWLQKAFALYNLFIFNHF
jgi:hypothetical protein